MVDLHSHILPEMDDGSKNIEMTQRMLSAMWRQNIRTVVATPHFYASRDLPEAFLRRRAKASAALGEHNPRHPRVILGAEVAYFDGMCRNSDVLEQLQLGNSGLLLVEMPFAQWNDRVIREICDLPQQTGLIPVLAHVDRYRKRNQLLSNMNTLLDCGVLFQCNADAFLHFGSRSWALGMMRKGLIHFLGSDAHNLTTRQPNLSSAVQVIEKKLGREPLKNLMTFSREQLLG